MSKEPDTQHMARIAESVEGEVSEVAQGTLALAYTDLGGLGKEGLSFLAVAEGVKGKVERLQRASEGAELDILVVERELFESDVESSSLLEAVAGRLLLPFAPLKGAGYLSSQDRLYKMRKIRESLTGLALDYPELSSELLIEPRFFAHDALLRLSHILPYAPSLLQTLDEDRHGLVEGYMDALTDLENDGIIGLKDDFIVVDRGFVDSVLDGGVSVQDQLSRVQGQLMSLAKIGLAGIADLLRPIPGYSITDGLITAALGSPGLPQIGSYLHFPTAIGPAPISGTSRIEDLLSMIEPSSQLTDVRLRRFSGVLNEVYLLMYAADGVGHKAILKRYPTWVSLKWAPIALWTLGTQNFAVLGRTRLEKECTITNLLDRSGIRVPRILHVSFEGRLLLREYVEGENLVAVIRAAIRGGCPEAPELDYIKRAGNAVAAVHGAGLTLGDCKPGNFIVASEGDPFIVDLEQGARGGNETWDLAEFLYFSGHHAGPLDPVKGVVGVAQCFIDGYLSGGGSRQRVADAARLKYTKVFAPLVLPHVILAIAKTCRSREL